jgi:hypothetical protein
MWTDKETDLIVVAGVDVTAHAEVRDLHGEPSTHQAVATRQVAVYEALTCQVLHPSGDLESYWQQRVLATDTQIGTQAN